MDKKLCVMADNSVCNYLQSADGICPLSVSACSVEEEKKQEYLKKNVVEIISFNVLKVIQILSICFVRVGKKCRAINVNS